MKWNKTRFNYLSSVAIVYTLKTLSWEIKEKMNENNKRQK